MPGEAAVALVGGVGGLHASVTARRKLWKPDSDLPCSAIL
jgi:hypothetical protein